MMKKISASWVGSRPYICFTWWAKTSIWAFDLNLGTSSNWAYYQFGFESTYMWTEFIPVINALRWCWEKKKRQKKLIMIGDVIWDFNRRFFTSLYVYNSFPLIGVYIIINNKKTERKGDFHSYFITLSSSSWHDIHKSSTPQPAGIKIRLMKR